MTAEAPGPEWVTIEQHADRLFLDAIEIAVDSMIAAGEIPAEDRDAALLRGWDATVLHRAAYVSGVLRQMGALH